MLTGTEDIFGQSLISDEVALTSLSPVSLGILSDILVTSAPERVEEVTAYFIESYEDSELLWKAYRAQAELLYQEEQLDKLFYVIEEAQGSFGADSFMDWAQIMKAEAQFSMRDYEGAEESYNMVLGVSEWRGATYARAMIGMGNCRLEKMIWMRHTRSFSEYTFCSRDMMMDYGRPGLYCGGRNLRSIRAF